MIKDYFFLSAISLLVGFQSFAQELKLFNTSDFDLNGKVKKCTVITDYGREVFEFDENGLLLKSITAYNDEDQDITVYKYKNGFLFEKRMESYKDNVLDESSSMANFYEIDTTGQKIIREQIISYDKEFVEMQEYIFGEEDRIFKITTSHENAVDETKIEYSNYKDEATKSYFTNGVIEKSERVSTKKLKSGDTQKIVVTKEFIDGEPNKAMEQRYNSDNLLIYKEHFLHKTPGGFVSQEIRTFNYNAKGILEKEIIKKGKAVSEKEFIFQFDDNVDKNWVKKITTPENTYTTRNIEYYPSEENEEPQE